MLEWESGHTVPMGFGPHQAMLAGHSHLAVSCRHDSPPARSRHGPGHDRPSLCRDGPSSALSEPTTLTTTRMRTVLPGKMRTTLPGKTMAAATQYATSAIHACSPSHGLLPWTPTKNSTHVGRAACLRRGRKGRRRGGGGGGGSEGGVGGACSW